MAYLSTTGTFTCPLLVEKTLDVWKKAQIVDIQVQYTFEVAKTEEIFDFLVKEKFITFPKDHRIPSKDELRGKAYCKYHNSWNHTTNACWGFRNVIHDMINKGIVFKFPDKKESMTIDEDPFLPAASINTTNFDPRALIESKKAGKLSPRKIWVSKYCLVHVDRLKKEWVAICIDHSSGRNLVKGIHKRTGQNNRFSKKKGNFHQKARRIPQKNSFLSEKRL